MNTSLMSRGCLYPCFLILLAVLVADGFWVGPLWGYQKGQEGQDAVDEEVISDDVDNKYPAWMAPADLDDVLKRVGKRKLESVYPVLRPVLFPCVPRKTRCLHGGTGPVVVEEMQGYFSMCKCMCPSSHLTAGCM